MTDVVLMSNLQPDLNGAHPPLADSGSGRRIKLPKPNKVVRVVK